MSVVISVKKERLARAEYSITVIENGRQTGKHEISGSAGNAAAEAINIAAKKGGLVVGCEDVLERIPPEFCWNFRPA